MQKTKKYLEEENKWLWYNYLDTNKDTCHIEVRQYNKKGELIQMSSISVPPKEYRVKHPKELK
jgi:hypothetical protein